jgi:sugar lactone lactonase YvrE
MKQTHAAFCLASAVLLAAAAQAGSFVKAIDLAPRVRPESITRGWGGRLYVSIQGPSADAATLDGEIVEVDAKTGAITPFVPPGQKLANPRGLAFTGQWLVVTDTTNVWKIDEAGHVSLAAEPASYPFPPIFFNDAAPEKGGHAVYVSEMGPGRAVQRDPAGNLWPTDSTQAEDIPTGARVYRIALEDGRVTNVFTPTRKILITNGITESKREPGHLLAVDFFHGSVVDVDVAADTKRLLATGPFRGADGIEQAQDGTLYVSSYENGKVWRMDARGENVQKLFDLASDLGTTGRQTLADLALDEGAGLLYVPDTLGGRIIVLNAR